MNHHSRSAARRSTGPSPKIAALQVSFGSDALRETRIFGLALSSGAGFGSALFFLLVDQSFIMLLISFSVSIESKS